MNIYIVSTLGLMSIFSTFLNWEERLKKRILYHLLFFFTTYPFRTQSFHFIREMKN